MAGAPDVGCLVGPVSVAGRVPGGVFVSCRRGGCRVAGGAASCFSRRWMARLHSAPVFFTYFTSLVGAHIAAACVCLSTTSLDCAASPPSSSSPPTFLCRRACVCGGRGWWVCACACVSRHLHTRYSWVYSCSYVCLPVRAHPLVYLKCVNTRGPQARRSW